MEINSLPEVILVKDDIKKVIKSIDDGNIQHGEYIKSGNFPTQNGKHQNVWNYIFRNIEKSFSSYPFKCYKINRGNLWEFLAIYRDDINVLYILLREERLNEIRKSYDTPYHYLRVINSKNKFSKKVERQQLSFLSESIVVSDEYIQEDLDRMLGDINDKVKTCVTILFTEERKKVNRISGNILNYDLDLIRKYEWNEHITVSIDEIVDTKDEQNIIHPQIELGIRKHVKKENTVYAGCEEKNTKEIIASKEKIKNKAVEK